MEPRVITEQDIENLKDAAEARKLSKQFHPQIPLKKCTNLGEFKERLRVGLKRQNGKMRDIEALGKLMNDLRNDDEKKREYLISLFAELESYISQADENLKNHLQEEIFTRNYSERIADFKIKLKQERCPILVVGQVSSGKSSLLNLFLGNDYLPSELVSCTASVCELTYADSPTAELLYENGEKEVIAFEERNNYISKDDKRDERFRHDSIRLGLPVPFLKSGIVLVDTPGIGENATMENVLLNYVKKNNVFGFIFVMKCNDSGGILQRFKSLVRKLADIKDEFDQRKLDPKSVLFVANFWDQVPREDEEMTRQQIINTLQKETCLHGLNPRRQLFFMNTKYAWHTWELGLISDNYDRLIDGIQEFFPIGHKRKLEVAYLYHERLLDKVLHPLRVYLAKVKKTKLELSKEVQMINRDLAKIDKELKTLVVYLKDHVKSKSLEIKSKLYEFLSSKEATDGLCNWKPGEIYREEQGDSWAIIAKNLEDCFEEKLQTILASWENENRVVQTICNSLVKESTEQFKTIQSRLAMIEKNAWSAEPDFDLESWNYPSNTEEINSNDDKEEAYSIPFIDTQIDWNKVLPQNYAEKHFTSIGVSRGTIFNKIFKKRGSEIDVHYAAYKGNKVKYMQKFSQDILQQILKGSGSHVDELIEQQIFNAKVIINTNVEEIKQKVQTNRKMTQSLKKLKIDKHTIEYIYQPMESKLTVLFEKSIVFRIQHLLLFDYLTGSVKICDDLNDVGIRTSGLFGEIRSLYLIENNDQRRLVTGKRYKHTLIATKNEAFLEYSDIFFHFYNLSALQGRNLSFVPILLGLAQPGPSFLFDSQLWTAEEVLKTNKTINKASFLSKIGKGLQYLHERKLAHMDLCLSSILVNEYFEPILPNPYYPMKVPFPHDLDIPMENYFYMPPEVFPYKKYTFTPFANIRLGSSRQSLRLNANDGIYGLSADIYSLSLMAIELLIHQGMFEEIKQDTIFSFMGRNDPIRDIHLLVNEKKKKKNVNESRVTMCLNNIKLKRTERINITEWNAKWTVAAP